MIDRLPAHRVLALICLLSQSRRQEAVEHSRFCVKLIASTPSLTRQRAHFETSAMVGLFGDLMENSSPWSFVSRPPLSITVLGWNMEIWTRLSASLIPSIQLMLMSERIVCSSLASISEEINSPFNQESPAFCEYSACLQVVRVFVRLLPWFLK